MSLEPSANLEFQPYKLMRLIMRSLLTTFLLGVILSSVGYAKETTGNVTILCYHTFLGKPKIVTDFSIAEFADQIDTLRKKGYQFVTFDQMKKGQINGKSVLLVIDDGNISAYSAYEQVLKPRHIKAMFAIYPGIVNRVKFAMTWDQVRQLVADGNEIASHGYFHEFLNKDL
ncbi:hypothetical protein EBR96_06040, partial [bacterium]|nr:hypothetical protein [bacterium]